MAKRRWIPAALHAELTEYSSLLRALRTSDTLDLASHLIQPPPSFISQASLAGDVSVTDDDADDEPEAKEETFVLCALTGGKVSAISRYYFVF